jgi:tRNA wybutosine-synthesizing protein 2
MRVRAVPKERIREIRDEDWVDPDRRPYVEGDVAWIPVRDNEPCDREISERCHYEGRGFFSLGDVDVLHGDRPTPAEVEEIVRFHHPRGVLWIESLNDIIRTPASEILWGEVGEVEHRESGYSYLLDPRKVMFSQGNRIEKLRMAGLIRKSGRAERVADMFAGIGYFTIPMAGSGAQVYAMEINPVAFEYLNRNIAKNKLGDQVVTSLGDCRSLLVGLYDRMVMGHFEAITMLPDALNHAGPGSVIHLHSIGPVEEQIRSIVDETGFSASIHVHKVKKYRPHAWHVVQDVTLS